LERPAARSVERCTKSERKLHRSADRLISPPEASGRGIGRTLRENARGDLQSIAGTDSQASKDGASRSSRIASLDAIRAFAACTIAWNHCFSANENLHFENPLLAGIVAFPSVYFGNVVFLFFIISGAVHYYFLKDRSGRPVQWGFLSRNFRRLCEPALVALFVSTSLYLLSYLVKGFGHLPTAQEFASNVLFVAHFTGENWTNVVLWNIAIQVQHLLWIGLIVIPLLRYRNAPLIVAFAALGLSVALTAAFSEGRQDLFYYYPFFFLGFLLYQVIVHKRHWLAFCAIGVIAWISHVFGSMAGLVALIPFALVLVNDWRGFSHPAVAWLGRISFSLYLIHVPIGSRVINLGSNWVRNDFHAAIVYVSAFAAIFAAAIAFQKWIEVPCTQHARRIFS
jgi:peptidoglycan/LPS O-acetylase OafA/YrhL